jgi:hypothetical protein
LIRLLSVVPVAEAAVVDSEVAVEVEGKSYLHPYCLPMLTIDSYGGGRGGGGG